MPDNLAARVLAPVLAFVGAVVMLSYLNDVPTRIWFAAVVGSVAAAYVGAPITVAWLIHRGATWLPTDGSVHGVVGLLLGLGSIHFIGGLSVLGKRFAEDPLSVLQILPWRRK
jgi:hypothetical protein